tara:strand:+ start:1569 stop:2078 length:510 start_codon:yes stop_codon:yes gene_type:complete
LGVKVARSRISVGSGSTAINLKNLDAVLNQAVERTTAAVRAPLEREMRVIYQNVRKQWPRPTSKNRGGNRRKREQGFSPVGWASTGRSFKAWRWSTNIRFKHKGAILIVALTNDASKAGKRKGRYPFYAHFPYPKNNKLYYKEFALKPAKRASKRIVKELAHNISEAMK